MCFSRLSTAFFFALLGSAASAADLPRACWPGSSDQTWMWWAEGFPGHSPEAPWWRCVQTGRYAFVLDTQAMRVPHFGPIAAGTAVGNRAWDGLPPADLKLWITADGREYRCSAGGAWSEFSGPRIIESGRWVQRADVTDLTFTASDGSTLAVEARCETIAWPDRLGVVLAARPAVLPVIAGEASFGYQGGGFGLDGTNHLAVPHRPELDPQVMTSELWVYLPENFLATTSREPWLLGKNHNEEQDGAYGLVLANGKLRVLFNLGGGRANLTQLTATTNLRLAAWNHVAFSYDGATLRLFIAGQPAGEAQIGRPRNPGSGPLVFGRRPDGVGDGRHIRAVIDSVRIYGEALPASLIQRHALLAGPAPGEPLPLATWNFQDAGQAALTAPRARWRDVRMGVSLAGVASPTTASGSEIWHDATWHETGVMIDPVTRTTAATETVAVTATELPSGRVREVSTDALRGWQRIDLDGVVPSVPGNDPRQREDGVERVRVVLTNPTAAAATARLLLAKDRPGFSVSGISAMIRDHAGNPTGIPVQLSKNWHDRPQGGVYRGTWFHGFTEIGVPPRTSLALEVALAYARWGGLPAASHAQLCLIGWGSNQLWDQSALGSWGESICYEPDRVQARSCILDVRPLLVRQMNGGDGHTWTHNVGGGDFLLLLDPAGKRILPGQMRTTYATCGPCRTEVTYAGTCGPGIAHAMTVSLTQGADITRGTYRLRMDVRTPVDFSRLVLFQIGADSYSYTGERKMAVGDEQGLAAEWATQWGGMTYRTPPLLLRGSVPWVSLHEGVPRAALGAWANRGLVLRTWAAKLGGQPAAPWVAEHGVTTQGHATSTIDLIPPPGVTRLLPGDYLETIIEHVIMPRHASDYLGPDTALRAALARNGNTWRMIQREAVGNDRQVSLQTGVCTALFPAVTIQTVAGRADGTLRGGLGHLAFTCTGFPSYLGGNLLLDGESETHAVPSAACQIDFDPVPGTWSQTWILPASEHPRSFRVVPRS